MSESESFANLKEDSLKSPQDLTKWTTLITKLEELINNNQLSTISKDEVYDTFDQFLSHWPLLFGYWKKYSSVTYQLDGLERSLLILKRALDVFPTCLELWVDYLGILIGQPVVTGNDSEKLKLEDGSVINEDLVRSEFERGIRFVGYVFMGHEVWEKYVAWELEVAKAKNDDESGKKNVTGVLWRAIKVPLYQYSKMYATFDKVWRSLPLNEVVQITGIKVETDINEDTLKREFDIVFGKTQAHVSELWAFESIIKQKYFNNVIVNEDVESWNKYIDFQILKYRNSTNDKLANEETLKLYKSLVITTFEQCLIPMAKVESFWKKYVQFLVSIIPSDSTSTEIETQIINDINHAYSRACNVFLDSTHYKSHLQWALFLEAYTSEEASDANDVNNRIEEIYLSTIRENKGKYEPIIAYVRYKSRKIGISETTVLLKTIVDEYLKLKDSSSQGSETTPINTDGVSSSLPLLQQRLLRAINEDSVGMLITELIKLQATYLHEINTAKSLIMKFWLKDEVKGCIPFWTQSYEIFKRSVINSKNKDTTSDTITSKLNTPAMTDLTNLINHILTTSTIPHSHKQLLITSFNEFLEFNQGLYENINKYYPTPPTPTSRPSTAKSSTNSPSSFSSRPGSANHKVQKKNPPVTNTVLPYNILSFDRIYDLYTPSVVSVPVKPVLNPGHNTNQSNPPTITNVDINEPASRFDISEMPTFKGVEKVGKVEELPNE